MEGLVKKYFMEKGYGFIEGTDGKDYFIHHSQLPKDVVLNDGDRVNFEPTESFKGLAAKDVTIAKNEVLEQSSDEETEDFGNGNQN